MDGLDGLGVAYTSGLKSSDSLKLWHLRLGHLNYSLMLKMGQHGHGIPRFPATKNPFCESCTVAKMARKISRTPTTRTTQKLELVHSDIGYIPTPSLRGAKYYVTFTDDYTRFRWVYPMAHKSDFEATFYIWKAQVEKEAGCSIQRLRTDGGGEYISNSLQNYLQNEGIKHEKTPAHTPEMNPVSERINRTLVEYIRAMLHEAGLLDSYWAEAINTACYLRNITPTAWLRPTTTPYEAWHGRIPTYNHLRIFGSECWVHIPHGLRKKLDPKARKGIFVGYGGTSSLYRVAIGKKVSIFRDVRFNEDALLEPPISIEKLRILDTEIEPETVLIPVAHENSLENGYENDEFRPEEQDDENYQQSSDLDMAS